MTPSSNDPFWIETQRQQTELLRQLSAAMARIEATIESWHAADAEQNKRLDTQSVRVGALENRISSLEHERTRAETALRITWGVAGALFVVIGYAIQWLLSR